MTDNAEQRFFLNGAEAIARGAIHAGCTFFAGYPITPATPILLHMSRELPKVGGVAIQTEDEIAAMGFCIGAALTGARAMTATSGPGISLYSEQIGAAIMGEVPLVIVDCQRLGPATGGATAVGQGDTQFLRWGTSGGYPVIVLAPTGVAECYTLTRRAFDLAERFRVPVFLATDKETVLTNATVEASAFEAVPVRERRLAPADGEFVPYRLERPQDVPPMSPFGGPHLLRFTASAHDEYGYLTKDPHAIAPIHEHLAAKIYAHVDELALFRADLQEGAETLVVSYGVTARAAEEAVARARESGLRVSALTVYSLWPVPERALRAALRGVKRIVVPELNLGQYRREIERLAADGQEVIGVHRVDGRLL
ncbi:MAG: pyruvate flavodoxin/ferredoxin oxidoreductase, partial [Anaerolineae bacterium]